MKVWQFIVAAGAAIFAVAFVSGLSVFLLMSAGLVALQPPPWWMALGMLVGVWVAIIGGAVAATSRLLSR